LGWFKVASKNAQPAKKFSKISTIIQFFVFYKQTVADEHSLSKVRFVIGCRLLKSEQDCGKI